MSARKSKKTLRKPASQPVRKARARRSPPSRPNRPTKSARKRATTSRPVRGGPAKATGRGALKARRPAARPAQRDRGAKQEAAKRALAKAKLEKLKLEKLKKLEKERAL